MKRLVTALLGITVAAWAAGCAQPPTTEIDAARAALAAVEAEAATYAPDAYRTAQDAAAQLDAELNAQEERLAFMRSYDRAIELAAAVGSAADRTQEAVNTEKERLRGETEQVVANATRALEAAHLSLEDAPEDGVETFQAELAAAEASLGEVDPMLTAGRFAEARRQADTALQAVERVNTGIAQAQTEAEAAIPVVGPGEVEIPLSLLADGTRLPAGIYSVRVTDEQPAPVAGEAASSERYVEFVQDGSVVGRVVAIAIPAAEIGEVAKSPGPGPDDARVDWLRGGEYVRVWLNRGGTNYLIHLGLG